MANPSLNYMADFTAQIDLTKLSAETGYRVTAPGESVTVRIAATPTGAAIGALSATAPELTPQVPARYQYTFDTAALQTDLTAYLGLTVYQVWSIVGDIDDFYTAYTVTNSTAVTTFSAPFDSADLLDRVYDELNLPGAQENLTDTQVYRLLSDAQRKWVGILSTHCPEVMYNAPTTMVSTDDGYTYYWPNQETPLGYAELRDGRTGKILRPGTDWDQNADVVFEGDHIRFPNGIARQFSGGLYTRYITLPGVIDDDTEPTMKPVDARQVLVFEACAAWCHKGGLRDPSPYQAELQRFMWGDPNNPGDAGLIARLKTQLFWQHAASTSNGPQGWWTSSDLMRI